MVAEDATVITRKICAFQNINYSILQKKYIRLPKSKLIYFFFNLHKYQHCRPHMTFHKILTQRQHGEKVQTSVPAEKLSACDRKFKMSIKKYNSKRCVLSLLSF